MYMHLYCFSVEALCKTCVTPPLLFKIIFWLGYCNSLVNPVIYACSSREFKRAFVQILRCQFGRRPRHFLRDSFFALRSVPSNNASLAPADESSLRGGQGPPTAGTLQAAPIYTTRVFGFSKPRTSLDGLKSLEAASTHKRSTDAIFRHMRQPKRNQSQRRRRRPQQRLDCNYYYVEYDSPILALKLRETKGRQTLDANRASVSTISDDGSVVREISDEETTSGKDKDPTHS